MAEYDNANSGALFENQKREKSSHPHMKGSATIKTPDGELIEYWVSAWQKTSKKGDDFFSLSFQVKDDQGGKKSTSQQSGSSIFKKRDEAQSSANSKSMQEELSDDLPF